MDFRILSTIERIKKGLFDNLKNKPFRLITNSDIINKAEISSRTFYRYFKDKNDLLDKVEEELIDELKSNIANEGSQSKEQKDITTITNQILQSLLRYCYDHKDEITILLSKNGDIGFWVKIKQTIEEEAVSQLKQILGDKYFATSMDKLKFNAFVDSKIASTIDWLDYIDTISIQDAYKLISAPSIDLTLHDREG